MRGKRFSPTRRLVCVMLATLVMPLVSGCGTAKVVSRTTVAEPPALKPAVLYVADFDLQVENIKEERGLLPGPSGPIRRFVEGHADDPEALAQELVDLMADSIVKDLTKAGFQAIRLPSGAKAPPTGWLVRGVFTEVQQGNRIRRAVIGLGAGETDMEVVTSIDNLSDGPPKPFYQVETDANSGKKPGAAATLILSPFGIPVHFVLAGGDLKTNTKKTAAQIAKEVVLRISTIKS